MLVSVVGDGYEPYYLDEDTTLGYKIDITQKFYDRYKAYVAEEEFIQSKLHRYYKDCEAKELMNLTKAGRQPIGF